MTRAAFGGAAIAVALAMAPSAHAACATPANEIEAENCKAGAPASEWDVSGAGSESIQGFATDISVNRGGTISFKVDTDTSAYKMEVYRLGYYGGDGARHIATVVPMGAPQLQPPCQVTASTGLVDCGNWGVSLVWTVPGSAVSGIYVGKLVRNDGTGASHIPFVVRDDTGASDVLFQTSDTTWQAYNQYGGNSLYTGSPAGRAYKVSYNRPFTTRQYAPEDFIFNAEYPMLRWLERNGYDVSYTSGVDTDRRGAELLEHRAFLSVGHDEYWSGTQRANVEAARAAGVSLAFFSGNEVFWKTRWESSNRTLVTYKETHANAKIDPLAGVWTGTWRDPRFSPPADGGRPENALTGQLFTVNAGTTSIRVPAADGKLRFWRHTGVATQPAGATATLGSGTLGYEWDEDVDNGARPAGAIRLSSTTLEGADVIQDYGSIYGSGTAVHRMTLYRAPSGARVFGAGTVQWAWGLDSTHDRGSAEAEPDMQQATANLLADMGALPRSLQAGLVAPATTTDGAPPSSTITAPANNTKVQPGSQVTVSGTAGDSGGAVGGVEVSTDGGASWHPATGRSAWTYTWKAGGSATLAIRSRAIDDSGNIESPGPGITVIVGSGRSACPCSIWDGDTTPATPAETEDDQPVEVGVKFRAQTAGKITALRFYKGETNTGPHVGHLWTRSGQLLATVPFSGETASGWQQARLATPVELTPGITYVASYYAPNGNYASDLDYFEASGVDSGPLRALQNGEEGGNGVYAFGASGTFPTEVYRSENYWVDVVFEPPPATPVPPGPDSGAGPGTGAAPGGSAAPRRGLKVRISPRRVRMSRNGTVALRVACPGGEQSCRVRLRLRLASRYVAAKRLGIAPGNKRTFKLRLSSAARRKLARKRVLRVTAVAAVRDLAGNSTITRVPIRLLAPKRR